MMLTSMAMVMVMAMRMTMVTDDAMQTTTSVINVDEVHAAGCSVNDNASIRITQKISMINR